jgi:hypothetical protein
MKNKIGNHKTQKKSSFKPHNNKNTIKKRLRNTKKTIKMQRKSSKYIKKQRGGNPFLDYINNKMDENSLFGIEIEIGVKPDLWETLQKIANPHNKQDNNDVNGVYKYTRVFKDPSCQINDPPYKNTEYASLTLKGNEYRAFRESFLSVLFEKRDAIMHGHRCGIHIHWSNQILLIEAMIALQPKISDEILRYNFIIYNINRLEYLLNSILTSTAISGRVHKYTTNINIDVVDIDRLENHLKHKDLKDTCGKKDHSRRDINCYSIENAHFEFRLFSLDKVFYEYYLDDTITDEMFKKIVLKELDKFIVMTEKFMTYALSNMSLYLENEEEFKKIFMYNLDGMINDKGFLKKNKVLVESKFNEIFNLIVDETIYKTIDEDIINQLDNHFNKIFPDYVVDFNDFVKKHENKKTKNDTLIFANDDDLLPRSFTQISVNFKRYQTYSILRFFVLCQDYNILTDEIGIITYGIFPHISKFEHRNIQVEEVLKKYNNQIPLAQESIDEILMHVENTNRKTFNNLINEFQTNFKNKFIVLEDLKTSINNFTKVYVLYNPPSTSNNNDNTDKILYGLDINPNRITIQPFLDAFKFEYYMAQKKPDQMRDNSPPPLYNFFMKYLNLDEDKKKIYNIHINDVIKPDIQKIIIDNIRRIYKDHNTSQTYTIDIQVNPSGKTNAPSKPSDRQSHDRKTAKQQASTQENSKSIKKPHSNVLLKKEGKDGSLDDRYMYYENDFYLIEGFSINRYKDLNDKGVLIIIKNPFSRPQNLIEDKKILETKTQLDKAVLERIK